MRNKSEEKKERFAIIDMFLNRRNSAIKFINAKVQ